MIVVLIRFIFLASNDEVKFRNHYSCLNALSTVYKFYYGQIILEFWLIDLYLNTLISTLLESVFVGISFFFHERSFRYIRLEGNETGRKKCRDPLGKPWIFLDRKIFSARFFICTLRFPSQDGVNYKLLILADNNFMNQNPVYHHISNLDNIDLNLIETNRLISISIVLASIRPQQRLRGPLRLRLSSVRGHTKPQDSNNCMSSQLYEY